jgi:ribosomal peptide maturation radical SAM protein 1
MIPQSDLTTDILAMLTDGDILLLVPPFGSLRDPALGPHILQALARERGCQVEILYVNLLLAAVIGVERYEHICAAPEFWMLGERMFARSAYGLPALGHHPEWCADEALSIGGRESAVSMFSGPAPTFDLEAYGATERMCQAFIADVVDALASLKYAIIGGTALEGQTNCCISLLANIKKARPETVTLMGGANCAGDMADGIASLSPNIDYIFSGESEQSFSEFLDGYASGKLPSSRIIRGEPVDNLDRLPLPDYEHFVRQYQRVLGDAALPAMRLGYETSRGCWWGERRQCRFCGLHTLAYREKSVAKAAREIARIKASYPDHLLVMADNIMPPAWPERLRQQSAPADLPRMAYQVKSNLSLRDLLELKAANIQAILPGLETFATHLLTAMQKGASGWQQLALLRNARCCGLYVDWFMLWGLPGDTRADYEQVLRILPLIRHLQPPRRFVHTLLMRFAPYLSAPSAFQIRNVRPWAVYAAIYPAGADRGKLANYYAGDYPCQAHEHPDVIRAMAGEIDAWKQAWKTARLTMLAFAGHYAVIDARKLDEPNRQHLLDVDRAQEVMTCRPYTESEHQVWAVDNALGVVIDARYVPLVTASPDLLLEFESSYEHEETELECQNYEG